MSAIKQLDAVSEAFRSFDFTEREIDKSQAQLVHLTGICPKCGDAGWWIDDFGTHYCECPAGHAAQEARDRDMPEQFFCAGCGEEISGEFCDDDGHGLCRACDYEQQAESAADRRVDR